MELEGRLLGGRYRIRRLLGSGGMGAVYVAEQEDLRKEVAVKVLLPSVDVAGTTLARFKLEALAAAKLGHPNIAQVTDFQARPDEPALIVMELLQGESLHAVLERERRMPPGRAVFIVMQILAALSAAHAAGTIHRDIKPANIFLTRTPAMADLVKVLDFGIAKAPAINAGLVTEPGRLLGTLAYMAPEQLRSGGGDHRIDLYAVGVCLFEMLAGSRPQHAKSLAELVSVFSAPLPSLQTRAPEIDPKLIAVVDRALSIEPGERAPRALDMLSSIAPWGPRDVAVTSVRLPSESPSTEVFSVAVVSPAAPVARAAQGTLASASSSVKQHAPLPRAASPIAPPRVAPPVHTPRATSMGALVSADLSKASLHSLLWAAAGLVFCCFPLGLVGVVLGFRARSIAQRLGLPLPVQAIFGIVLGVVSILWSLMAAFLVLVGAAR